MSMRNLRLKTEINYKLVNVFCFVVDGCFSGGADGPRVEICFSIYVSVSSLVDACLSGQTGGRKKLLGKENECAPIKS